MSATASAGSGSGSNSDEDIEELDEIEALDEDIEDVEDVADVEAQDLDVGAHGRKPSPVAARPSAPPRIPQIPQIPAPSQAAQKTISKPAQIPQIPQRPRPPAMPPAGPPAVPPGAAAARGRRPPTSEAVPGQVEAPISDRPSGAVSGPLSGQTSGSTSGSVSAPLPGLLSGPQSAPLELLDDRSGPVAAGARQARQATLELPPPLDIATPTVVEQALESLGQAAWAARAEDLTARIEATTDQAAAAALAYELGELCERYLGDESRAVKAFSRALQADPSLRPNLWAIRRVFYRRGMWPNLIKLIDAEVRFARHDEERADLLIEKGQVLEVRMGQPEQAREAYDKAASLSPGAMGALYGSERLALAAGDTEALARVLDALAESAAEPARKLVYLLDLARLHTDNGALAEAQDALLRAAALGVDLERVTRQRLRVAELTGDAREVVDAREARIAHLARVGPETGVTGAAGQTAADSDGKRASTSARQAEMVALRRRQAQVARDQLQDMELAWSYLQQALALAPGEPVLMADLADAAEVLGRYEELAELCAGWESLEGDRTRSLSLSLRRADALLRGGQRAEAHALLDSLARTAPGYLPITALRERDALHVQDWAALARAYLDAAAATRRGTWASPDAAEGAAGNAPDPTGAAAHLVGAGDVFDRLLGQPDEAQRCYLKALEAMPGFAPAVEALCALYERTGRLAEAAALLEEQFATPEERVHLLERLARFYWDLGQLEEVLSAEQRLLALDPDGPDNVRLRWRIDATLAELGRSEERVEALIELAEHLDVPARRAAALLTAARICDEELGASYRAATLYRQVLEASPGDPYARAARISLLRRSQRWEELVAERRAEVAALADSPTLALALREAADVLRYELGRSHEAAEVYRELLDRIPGHAGALHSLAGVLADIGDDDRLIDTLEIESVTQESPAAQALAILRLGRALERAGRTNDALDAYRRAAEAAPGSSLAAVALAELAAESEDPVVRAEAIVQLAQSRPDARLASELHEDAAWMWALDVDDPGRAAEALAQATQVADGSADGMAGAPEAASPGAHLSASLLQARQGDLAEVGEALARLAGAVVSPTVQSAALLRAAATAEVGGDPALARARLRAAVAAAPDDAGTAVAATELDLTGALYGDGDGEPVPVEELLVRADLFGMRAALAGTPAARDDWELEQAEALEEAGRLREAAQLIAAVLESNPGDIRALQLLRRVCRRGGDRATLARASLSLARVLGDSEGKIQLLREAATILDAELDDPATAAPVYRRILAEDPGAAEYDRLMEICRTHEDVRAQIELISNRLNWLDLLVRIDPEAARAKVPLLHDRALLRQGVGDVRGASRDLAQLLHIDPRHAEALVARARITADLGDAAMAAELYQRYLEVETSSERRAEAELTLSHILAEDMDDLAGAIEQLVQVVQRTPDDLEVRERLIGLLTRTEAWDQVLDQLRAVAQRRKTTSEQARDELRMAAVLRDRLGDLAGAEAALTRARELDPLNVDAVRELAELHAGNADRRRQVLREAARDLRRALAKNPERAGLHERLAVIAGWQGQREARYYALSAVAILGSLSADQEKFVADTGTALAAAAVPSRQLGPEEWNTRLSAVREPGAHVAADLWQVMAEAVTKTLGVEPAKLGFSRSDRIASKHLDKRYEALAHAAACFGVTNAEYYIAASKPGYARVLSLEEPIVCLGDDVARGASATTRFVLGRALAQARTCTGSVGELREEELTLFFAALAQVAGVPSMPAELADAVAADPDGMDERVRALQKHMGRRERRQLGRLTEPLAGIDVRAWRLAALSTGMRAGLLLAGDVRGAVDVLGIGHAGQAAASEPTVLDFLGWMVSEDHLWLRRHLGLSTAT